MAKLKRKTNANPQEQKLQQKPNPQENEEQKDISSEVEEPKQETACEEVAQTVEPEALSQEIEQVKSQLAETEKQRDEYLNLVQRVQADFDNFRRRNQNVRKDSFDDGAKTFATTLLPVIDNLERAIAAAAASPDESLKNGVEMVYRQMMEAFEKRGITPIDRLGQTFDPNVENAVMKGTPEEGEPGTVCAVFQKGYQMDGKLLRAAMVKVVPEE